MTDVRDEQVKALLDRAAADDPVELDGLRVSTDGDDTYTVETPDETHHGLSGSEFREAVHANHIAPYVTNWRKSSGVVAGTAARSSDTPRPPTITPSPSGTTRSTPGWRPSGVTSS